MTTHKRCCFVSPEGHLEIERIDGKPGTSEGDLQALRARHGCTSPPEWLATRPNVTVAACSAHLGGVLSKHHHSVVPLGYDFDQVTATMAPMWHNLANPPKVASFTTGVWQDLVLVVLV